MEPSWYGKVKWENTSVEEAAKMKEENDTCKKNNADVKKAMREKIDVMLDIVKEIWGVKSNAYKYIAKLHVPTEPWLACDPVEEQKKASQDAEKSRIEKERESELIKIRKEKTERAIIWLQARGKVLGKDFNIDNAHDVANSIAFDEAVEKIKGTFISFSGQNCDEPCDGYDGLSNRCQCGNRRVSYVMPDYADFEDMYVDAEAD